ncbi:glycosyltransferase family 25 protein [Acinetobacter faecalis]|uniref:glycosyltransferase family 25 protein n=1 Tax=Acinetobacter faecalis TaxID=2665161 RepID=UPI002A90A9DE|nr:glycosyltransferase family 25 protein [Acinetobacter faecalis]MDY6459282.1 glycosyltransferase family 25 protein [Acinetobacter faecalis]
MNVYVISLDQDIKRREELLKKFPKTYPKMQWVKAVNGKSLCAKEYFGYVQKYFNKNNKIITPSEVGCTLSHMKALNFFLESSELYALILEDDVRGCDLDVEKLIKKFSCKKSKGIYLLRDQNGFGFEKYIFGKKISDYYKIPKLSINFMFGSCAYIIDRESAKMILDYHSKDIQLTDAWLKIIESTKINFYYSPVFIHPEDLSVSHIENERAHFYTNEKNFFKRVYKQGIFWKLANRIRNDLCSWMLILKGYKRIHKVVKK